MKSQDDFEDRLTAFGKALRLNGSMAHSVEARIESELTGASSDSVSRSSSMRDASRSGIISMKQRIAYSGIAVATIVALVTLVVLVLNYSSSDVFAQVAANVRQAKSYSMEMVGKDRNSDQQLLQTVYWKAPGTYRFERKAPPEAAKRRADNGISPLPNGLVEVEIRSTEKPGISINYVDKSYYIEEAHRGYQSPLMMLESLGTYNGIAKMELGKRVIHGVDSVGFLVELTEIDPSSGEGTLELWIDPKENLPTQVVIEMKDIPIVTTIRNVKWNESFPDGFFDATPPEGYADKTRPPEDRESIVAKVVASLKLYAELSGGHYPKVEMVYGDVTLAEMRKFAGYKGPIQEDWFGEKRYGEILQATGGLAWINTILRNNADASYHGIEVGPGDAHKVLMQWKLPDGQVQRIFGDLRDEVVSDSE